MKTSALSIFNFFVEIFPVRAYNSFLEDYPLTNVQGFGGKLGERFTEIGLETFGQLKSKSFEELTKTFSHEVNAGQIFKPGVS